MGAVRRLGRAENRGLLVADAPVPRRDEGALPHPGLGFARRLLGRLVVPGDAGKGQRPAVLHQPCLDVLAVDLAPGDLPAAPIDGTRMASPYLAVGMLDQLIACRDAAGPALATRVEAELVQRGRLSPDRQH